MQVRAAQHARVILVGRPVRRQNDLADARVRVRLPRRLHGPGSTSFSAAVDLDEGDAQPRVRRPQRGPAHGIRRDDRHQHVTPCRASSRCGAGSPGGRPARTRGRARSGDGARRRPGPRRDGALHVGPRPPRPRSSTSRPRQPGEQHRAARRRGDRGGCGAPPHTGHGAFLRTSSSTARIPVSRPPTVFSPMPTQGSCWRAPSPTWCAALATSQRR
jgi:hypothetical protein